MSVHTPPSEATPVEDDGFVTDMSLVLKRADSATAEAHGGRKAEPAPLTRTERYLASLKAENDSDEARLAAIEAELIAVEEGHDAKQRQARAEYDEAVRLAKAKMDREQKRNEEDTTAALDALTDEKGDLSTVVLARHAAIEAIVNAEAGE